MERSSRRLHGLCRPTNVTRKWIFMCIVNIFFIQLDKWRLRRPGTKKNAVVVNFPAVILILNIECGQLERCENHLFKTPTKSLQRIFALISTSC